MYILYTQTRDCEDSSIEWDLKIEFLYDAGFEAVELPSIEIVGVQRRSDTNPEWKAYELSDDEEDEVVVECFAMLAYTD